MKAMILAAGLGTRLRPLTDTRPKALVEINGRTLLEITLSRLRAFGVTEVIINVHHFADMVVDYLKSKNNFGMRIEISREDDLLLDTGGGLKKAARFFLKGPGSPVAQGAVRGALRPSLPEFGATLAGEPFLLHNVDVISTIDLRRMVQFHNENRALATLAVQSRESSRLLLFNDQLQLCGRRIAGHDTLIPIPPDTAIPSPRPAVIPSSENAVISSEARNPSSSASPNEGTAPQPPKKGPIGVIPSEARNLSSSASPNEGTASQPPEKGQHGVIPSEARNPGRALAQANIDQTPPAPNFGVLHPFAFSGIHIISPRLLPLLTEEGVFSIIDPYLRLAAQGEKILAFRSDEYYWRDLGRPDDLTQAALDLRQNVVWGSEL